ncbi:MAG: phage major capsid protein [Isosphaeraceae bacterium]|nr:phage major capsid protein [Isosphaeraceae bacterium]
MKRLYKCLKSFPAANWSSGRQYELEEADALEFVESGRLEPVAADETEAQIERIVKRVREEDTSVQARNVAAVVDEVFRRLRAEKALGPCVGVVTDEVDKTKSFADQLKQIVIAQCPVIAGEFGGMVAQQKAIDRLRSVYGSVYSTWGAKAALAESSGTTGGYTVQPEYSQELLKMAAEQSIVRPFANVKTLPAREAFYPMLNQTAGQPAQGTNYAGGAYMNWTSEASTVPETAEPNFKQVHVVTNELTGLAKISRTLMSDTFLAMDAELRSIFATAISYEEDYQFLQGNGTGKPLGILNAPAKQQVTRTTANLFKLADAANMMAKLLPRSRPSSIWVMESLIFSQLVQLVDASGRVTYIPNVGSGYDKYPLAQTNLVLFGRPVLFTEKLNTLGTPGDVLLADFSYYVVADTGTLEIAVSDQYAFNTNQLTFRVLKRVDGRPQLDAPFTQQNGNTVTPFVTLSS